MVIAHKPAEKGIPAYTMIVDASGELLAFLESIQFSSGGTGGECPVCRNENFHLPECQMGYYIRVLARKDGPWKVENDGG